MTRKPIQVSDRAHEIIRRDAIRQSMQPNTAVSMRDVIEQLAEKLNGKYKYIEG